MIVEFKRQPRFLPHIPSGKIDVPNPPSKQNKPEISWFSLLAPPIVMLTITVLISLTSQSMYLLISVAATVMSIIVALSNAASQIRKYNKAKKEREKKYTQFIADTRSELMLSREQQIKSMHEMNPDPTECIQRMIKVDNRLWERTPAHQDFLSMRVGIGSAPLNMKINYTKQAIDMENDPLNMEPHRLALEFQKINDVPVVFNLIESEICGIAGEKHQTKELVRNILIQCVAHHCYEDVRIIILASSEGIEQWDWMKYLPHCWNDDYTDRFILCGKAMAHQTLSELYPIIKERESKDTGRSALPHYVFIVEDSDLLENERIAKYIYNGSSKIGVSTIFLAPNKAYLPMNCRTIITIDGKNAEIADRISGEKEVFAPDCDECKDINLAGRMMASLRIKKTYNDFSLPNSLTLLEMLKVKKNSEVNVKSLWENNKTFMGMRVPIGAKAGSELFHLDMHETGHGPHGLVAGTTGSGKSELLQSIIISLAINFHPHDIVFVLIDYKGGGMADVFKGLPHLVGTITNLGGNQTTRALLSIKSELLRRQRVFSEYGVNNIDKYQKLYSLKKEEESETEFNMPAIPHLIMIADEFAELKQDQPDFMKELVSAARVGRSLGVHLILATQKPAGVVDDQIWSNSKFKICLKVQDEHDSKDVIKRPDAAMIKEPGRAYIQVGNDEIFELFQSAYSGADYDPDGEMQKSENKTKRLYRVALNGKTEQIYPLAEEKIAKKELPSQLKAMVEHISSVAEENNITPLEGPWPPPLPEKIFMDKFFNEVGMTTPNGELLCVPVGLIDNPREQAQDLLKIDFAADGNMFVYGAPGTGKTYFLKSLCLSLAHSYTPQEVNIYIMDFGGVSLKAFEMLPHCGGVMTLEQETIINQFILFLFRCIEDRKAIFEESGYDSFNDYRASGKIIPAIVVIIDNYFALSETYEEIDVKINVLAREGLKYGIYLVLTATNLSLIKYKLSVNFKMALSFQLIDKSEYGGIVGRTEGLEPDSVLGRGLVRGKPPMEFQAVLPEFEKYGTDEIIELFNRNTTDKAIPIPIMPSKIGIKEINGYDTSLAIGLNDNDLQPVYVDLATTHVFMVAGDSMTGKSTILISWIEMLSDADIYVLDSSSMGLFKVMNKPNVKDLSQIDYSGVQDIEEILKERREQLLDCRRQGGDVKELINSWKQIVFVIDKLSELVDSDNFMLKELLEKIIKNERGMKVAIIAADNTIDLASNWDNLVKAIRNQQTGLLLGSLKEQNLFTARFPYGVQEKEFEFGDGYLISKNKYIGLRCATIGE